MDRYTRIRHKGLAAYGAAARTPIHQRGFGRRWSAPQRPEMVERSRYADPLASLTSLKI